MAKSRLNFKIIAALLLVASLAGCGKKDDVEAIKQQLQETQGALEYWEGAYKALSIDFRNLKASRRDLNTQLGTVVDSTKTAEEQLNIYTQLIASLQLQVQELNSVVSEQEQIIAQQEADLKEFMSMLGLSTDEQTVGGQTTGTQTSNNGVQSEY